MMNHVTDTDDIICCECIEVEGIDAMVEGILIGVTDMLPCQFCERFPDEDDYCECDDD